MNINLLSSQVSNQVSDKKCELISLLFANLLRYDLYRRFSTALNNFYLILYLPPLATVRHRLKIRLNFCAIYIAASRKSRKQTLWAYIGNDRKVETSLAFPYVHRCIQKWHVTSRPSYKVSKLIWNHKAGIYYKMFLKCLR